MAIKKSSRKKPQIDPLGSHEAPLHALLLRFNPISHEWEYFLSSYISWQHPVLIGFSYLNQAQNLESTGLVTNILIFSIFLILTYSNFQIIYGNPFFKEATRRGRKANLFSFLLPSHIFCLSIFDMCNLLVWLGWDVIFSPWYHTYN